MNLISATSSHDFSSCPAMIREPGAGGDIERDCHPAAKILSHTSKPLAAFPQTKSEL